MATGKELKSALARRYRMLGCVEKGRILDEFVANTGFHRKHAMRLLRCDPDGQRGAAIVRGSPRCREIALGHVRDPACAAFEAWMEWRGRGPEPTVDFEINYVPHPISISRACGMVWNYTDIVPCSLFDPLSDMEGLYGGESPIKRHTYAVCARAILENTRKTGQGLE